MLDIRLIRKELKAIEAKLKTKDDTITLGPIAELDERIRKLKTEVEELKAMRNALSKEIGEKKRRQEKTDDLMEKANHINDKIGVLDEELSSLEKKIEEKVVLLPNIPMEDIPVSLDPKDNVCIKTFGKKTEFSFPFKNHVELNEKLDLFDFKRGAKISGSGWPVYKGMGARLEWALINYMLETHLKNGFEMWMPPHLAKTETVFGSGQLPKFEKQLFKISDEDYHLYLIPTAEVALNGLHMDEILKEEELPLRYVAYTPCFRREAGAAGSSERGLIRVHQFNKVEMFCFTKPEESALMFEQMMKSAESILEGLGLHYRSMLLVTGDMSYASAKTVDIEAWLPGQNRYYEVSSVSNCTDFQARRAQIRFRRGDDKPEFVHTLNGSGLATSRLMVALLENNQKEDGSVEIPSVLHKYLGGLTEIRPKE